MRFPRTQQAAPIAQAPYDGQNYNRYSYEMNNPLSLTDPSGYSWWTKWGRTAAAIGVAWALGPAGFWKEVGGIAGAAGAGASAAPFLSSVVAGFAAGEISGGNMQSAVQGALFATAFYGAGSFADEMGGEAARQGSGIWAEGGIGRAAVAAAER